MSITLPKHEDTNISKAGYFGPERWEKADDSSIFSGVGRLSSGNLTCTAFLISSEIALTAAHCVTGDVMSIDIGINATQNIQIAKYWKSQEFSKVLDSKNNAYFNRGDFAVLKLASPASGNIQFLEVASLSEVLPGLQAMSVGFPATRFVENSGERSRVRDANCTVKDFAMDSVLTDCAIQKGVSGGPLFVKTSSGQWKVVGIASTQALKPDNSNYEGVPYESGIANRATNISKHVQQIVHILREAGLEVPQTLPVQ